MSAECAYSPFYVILFLFCEATVYIVNMFEKKKKEGRKKRSGECDRE